MRAYRRDRGRRIATSSGFRRLRASLRSRLYPLVPSDTLTTLVTDARNSADTTPTLGRADGTGTTCGQLPHRRGREDPPQARLRAGALPRDGRLPELRDLVHDHLDSGGMPHVVLDCVRPGRPGLDHLGLAPRRPDEHDRRPVDGGDRLGLPDCGRPLLLGVEARQPRLGVVHGLVQPGRPDRGHGCDRLRPRDLQHCPDELLVRLPELEGLRLPHVCDRAGRRSPPEPVPDHGDGDAEHDLGLLAHDRGRTDRDHPVHGPGQPPVVQLRLLRDAQPDGVGWRICSEHIRQPRVLVRRPHRPAHVPVHDYGVRRVGTRRRRDPAGVAVCGRRDVHVRRRVRGLRLHPARCRHGSAAGRAGLRPVHRAVELGRRHGGELGDVHPLHLLCGAALLPDRVGDVRVPDAVRVLARPRRAGASALAPRARGTASHTWPSSPSSSRRRC